ncbi:hypothetical protein [Apilactobacillus timberlakei]|uniref:hypothetical protein n=1 Tax=Apilactobacillus timberlakei TaxID=2008380 RepID=UPI001127BD1B|nr:hypothetical protein [Apilactobacillus timberlakei]TPR16284.1 hypothetical protein DYZ95_07910 [Apilactobacillus timberlakei]TPR21545.1 hypothetical protein DY083_05860 [Apilactobacillus timberlakei]
MPSKKSLKSGNNIRANVLNQNNNNKDDSNKESEQKNFNENLEHSLEQQDRQDQIDNAKSRKTIFGRKKAKKTNQLENDNQKETPGGIINNDLLEDFEQEPTWKDKIKDKIKESREENKKNKVKNQINNKKIKLSKLGKNTKFKRNIIDLLGYKTITKDDYEFIVLADEYNRTSGLAEVMRVGGAGIGGLSVDMKRRVATGFIKFLRMYADDLEFMALPMPNDTKSQQRLWEQKYASIRQDLANGSYTDDMQREQMITRMNYIKQSLIQFQNVEINLINQGFFIVIFQDLSTDNVSLDTGEMRSSFKQTELDLQEKINNIKLIDDKYRSLNVFKISAYDKENLLRRINNPNTIV